jgi:hypothetical protein
MDQHQFYLKKKKKKKKGRFKIYVYLVGRHFLVYAELFSDLCFLGIFE